jgi:hypothetical protein
MSAGAKGPGAAGQGAVWQAFCDRVGALGPVIEAEAPTPEAAAEGVHHLANQLACWLTYVIGHSDPDRPAFFRSSDLVYEWGGPNTDQVARRCAIRGDAVYRISGHMGGCEEFVLQVKRGAAQSGGAGVAAEVSASSMGLGPGDEIDIVLGGPEQDGNWIPLPDDAGFVHIRDYYFDWRSTDAATFVIERIGPAAARPRRDADHVARVLDAAASEIEHSVAFWSGYQARMLGDLPANAFTDPGGAAGGVQEIVYSHAGVALPAGRALVVEVDPADAPLWDVQLYNRPWYEALDAAGRTTSTNHRMAVPDAEGVVRVVISADDPGSPNWLDTEGRVDVLASLRWWRPGRLPVVRAEVVPLADAPGAGTVSAEQRDAERRRRASHLAWRYRT